MKKLLLALAILFGSAGPALATDYQSGLLAPSVTPGTVLTATRTIVTLIYCNNTTATAASVTITNTAGAAIVSTYVIPPNSNVRFIDSSVGLLMVGIKWSQGTASAITCAVAGRQP